MHVALAYPILAMTSGTATGPRARHPFHKAARTLTYGPLGAAVGVSSITLVAQIRAGLADAPVAVEAAAVAVTGASHWGEVGDAAGPFQALHRGTITARQVFICVVIARAASGA